MADTNIDGGERPRSKTMVRLDLYNAYARLGVSPLLPTDEIKEVINRKRKEVMRKRRTRGDQQFGEEDAEMTRLQAIEDEIGSPKARAQYDRLNPQNVLLTVQPSPGDIWLDAKHRANLVTAWLVEELGRESVLPSPESLALWAPKGLDPDLVDFLGAFVKGDDRNTTRRDVDDQVFPEIADLNRLDFINHQTRNGPMSGESPSDASSDEHLSGGSLDG
jgi:hypothetical protein